MHESIKPLLLVEVMGAGQTPWPNRRVVLAVTSTSQAKMTLKTRTVQIQLHCTCPNDFRPCLITKADKKTAQWNMVWEHTNKVKKPTSRWKSQNS